MSKMKEKLHKLFEYRDGELIRKVRAGSRGQIGDSAGCLSGGRVRVRVEGKYYLRYRLIWIFHHGDIPDGLQVDHIDNTGLKSDDRIENLRLANGTQNMHNTKSKGYRWHKGAGKWEARIQHQGKYIHLGSFKCETAARSAYIKAKNKLAKEYSPYVT